MSDTRRRYTSQQRLIAALRDSAALFRMRRRACGSIETHISWCCSAGLCLQIKKALDLGFLDYSDWMHRRFLLRRGRSGSTGHRTRYLSRYVSIGGSPDDPVFDAQPAIEYAVRMRRFASAKLEWNSLLMRGKGAIARHIGPSGRHHSPFHSGLPAARAVRHSAPLLPCARRRCRISSNCTCN